MQSRKSSTRRQKVPLPPSSGISGDIAKDLLGSKAQVKAPRCGTNVKKPTTQPKGPPIRYRLNNVDQGAMGFMRMNLATLNTITENEEFLKEVQEQKERKSAGGAQVIHTGAAKSLVPIVSETDYDAHYPLKLQLNIWMDAFHEELRVYKSSVIASELLLHRVNECCKSIGQPNLLTTATALIIFTSFLPHLGQYQELARGIIEELAHVIYVSPSKSIGVSTNASAYSRRPFFDSFAEVTAAYKFHYERSKKFTTMMNRERRVLDRAVFIWQKSVCRKMLQQWCGFTKRHALLRTKYAKIFQKASSQAVVQRAVVAWRQYAHELQLTVMESRNSRTVEELNIAHQLQRQTQERLEAVREDCGRQERQAKELNSAVAKLRKSYHQVRHKAEDEAQLVQHIAESWSSSVETIFGDAHSIPIGANYTQWLDIMLPEERADISTAGSQMALRRSVAVGGKSKLGGPLLFKLMQRLCPPGVSLNNNFTSNNLSTAAVHAEKVCQMFRLFTQGVPPPINTEDIIRGDQLKARLMVYTLMEMYAGGCLSLFFPAIQKSRSSEPSSPNIKPSESEVDTAFGEIAQVESLAISAKSISGREDSQDVESTAITFRSRLNPDVIAQSGGIGTDVQMMSDDWETGSAMFRNLGLFNAQTQRAMAEATQLAETVQLHREGTRFFDLVAQTNGSSKYVPQEVLEQSLRRFVPADQMAVVEMLYPDEEGGITTITDIINYTMEVAEVIDRPSSYVLRNMEDHLVVSTVMNFMIDVKNADVQFVFKTFGGEVRHAFKIYSVKTLGRKQTRDHTKNQPSRIVRKGGTTAAREITEEGFFNFCEFVRSNTGVTLGPQDVSNMFKGIEEIVEYVDELAFMALICSLAVYYDPSPFVPLHSKTKSFLTALFQSSSDFVSKGSIKTVTVDAD